jgi:hypothetical protein
VKAVLVCVECQQRSAAGAEGWQGHLVDLDDDGEDEVVFYCASCAAREFGGEQRHRYRPGTGETS